MEYDRFAYNRKLFITGMICLVLCLVLLSYSLFILPHMIWNLSYDVPEFVWRWREYFKEYWGATENAAIAMVFSIFFIPALITGYIALYISNKIDRGIYNSDNNELVPEGDEVEAPPRDYEQVRESLSLGMKILLIAIGVFIVASIAEWLIAIPPPVIR